MDLRSQKEEERGRICQLAKVKAFRLSKMPGSYRDLRW